MEADGEGVESLSVCPVAAYVHADAELFLPSKNAIKLGQLQVAPENKKNEIKPTIFVALEQDSETLYCVS